ncbi:MAG: aminoglycoside phosphotransferase family protein [Planctomycetaceae bacterium]
MSKSNDGLGVSLPLNLSNLVDEMKLQLVEAEPITTLKTAIVERGTYRLQCDDGRTLKGRILRKPGQADRMRFVLQHMNQDAFSRVLAYGNLAILEEWIDGTSLASFRPKLELVARAGTQLVDIHMTPLPRNSSGFAVQTDRTEKLADGLEQLSEMGILSRIERDELHKQAAAHCPDAVEIGFVHRDYCAENLVQGKRHLCSIDNVKMAIGPLDEDLARTWYRWPMTEAQWNAFLSGYGTRRNPRAVLQHAPYWAILVVVGSALFRLRAQASEAEVPVNQLSDIAKNGLSLSNRFAEPASTSSKASVHPRDRIDEQVTEISLDCSNPSVACLEYAGCRIAIYLDNEATRRWLQEFLCPAFRLVDCTNPDWRVSLKFGLPAFLDPLRPVDANGLTMAECFTLDGQFKCHEVWQQTPTSLVLRLKSGSVFCEIDQQQATVTVYAENEFCRVRPTMMRVIREIATQHAIGSGHLPVHAAAVAYENRAILLAGNRRSGKTTLLLHALNSSDARFVCNDRGFVSVSTNQASINGMPTILRIRPDALHRLPYLERRYRSKPYNYCATIEESHRVFQESGTSALIEEPVTPRLTAAQLCDLVNGDAVGRTNLAALVFPHIAPEVESLRLQEIRPDVAANKLFREGLLTPTSPLRTSEVFRTGDATEIVPDEILWESCQQITALVPCYTCALGPAAYQRPFHVEMSERGLDIFSKNRIRP